MVFNAITSGGSSDTAPKTLTSGPVAYNSNNSSLVIEYPTITGNGGAPDASFIAALALRSVSPVALLMEDIFRFETYWDVNGTGGVRGMSYDNIDDSDGYHFNIINYMARFGDSNAPTSTVDIRATLAFPVLTRTSNTTLGNFDATAYLFDTTSAGITATLPAASSCPGRIYYIKKIAAANILTVASAGGSIESGKTSITVLNSGYQYQSDGTKWIVIGTIT